ncbi:hypothetical protein [Afipia sp. GAS231]|uniref:hypothetical protein n=1 Tax=Afipia sp. GAS231 TaxID=1882747 RepID=UPI00087CE700|nr:hypothetical protein [Afipia sp. GAS231]SDO49114.1 hypothetical protein SAMN05444050_4264 [Afipia sp. GAS231]
MRITSMTLESIKDEDAFCREFTNFAMSVGSPARLFPQFSRPRLDEAHGSWLADLRRVKDHEKHLINGLDHFKQCGHLAFWIRRLSPIVEFTDLDFGESEMPMLPKERALRELLTGYVNEYLAFDFGYQICKYYETKNKSNPSPRAPILALSPDYYQMTSHFMKFKNVSPHAMHLIYKSLFYFNGMDAATLSVVAKEPEI